MVVNNWIKAVSFLQLSDRRLKTNIEDIMNSMEIVSKLKGRTYQWIPENGILPSGKVIGLIAQEVYNVLPEVVYKDPLTGYLSVNYTEIIPVLIDAFNHFVLKMNSLQTTTQNEIGQLKDKIDQLSVRLTESCMNCIVFILFNYCFR